MGTPLMTASQDPPTPPDAGAITRALTQEEGQQQRPGDAVAQRHEIVGVRPFRECVTAQGEISCGK
jgi:hypothetical protein